MLKIAKDVDVTATATGNGHWGMPAGQRFKFTRLEVRVNLWEEEHSTFSAELRAYHDLGTQQTGTHGSLLNPRFDGPLPYTDRGCEQAAARALRETFPELSVVHVSGSEQGMQGEDYLSCDVMFRSPVTLQDLKRLGFTQEPTA